MSPSCRLAFFLHQKLPSGGICAALHAYGVPPPQPSRSAAPTPCSFSTAFARRPPIGLEYRCDGVGLHAGLYPTVISKGADGAYETSWFVKVGATAYPLPVVLYGKRPSSASSRCRTPTASTTAGATVSWLTRASVGPRWPGLEMRLGAALFDLRRLALHASIQRRASATRLLSRNAYLESCHANSFHSAFGRRIAAELPDPGSIFRLRSWRRTSATPDVLRLPAGEILTRFLAGGPGLVFTWYGFAVSCLPFFAGVVLLPSSFPEQRTLMRLSTVLGTVAGIVQVVGLLRWVFVVPYLARLYATTATADGRLAIEVAFSSLHQFAGVSLGEHTGQLFTAAWMVTLSFVLWQTHRRKLAVLGASTAVAWLIGLAEGFGTVLDGVPTQLGAVAPLGVHVDVGMARRAWDRAVADFR